MAHIYSVWYNRFLLLKYFLSFLIPSESMALQINSNFFSLSNGCLSRNRVSGSEKYLPCILYCPVSIEVFPNNSPSSPRNYIPFSPLGIITSKCGIQVFLPGLAILWEHRNAIKSWRILPGRICIMLAFNLTSEAILSALLFQSFQ